MTTSQAQMTRRLLWSTPWEPGRTIAFAALGTERAVGLVGDGQLIRPRRGRPGRACGAGLT
jgi:hypothetical protein